MVVFPVNSGGDRCVPSFPSLLTEVKKGDTQCLLPTNSVEQIGVTAVRKSGSDIHEKEIRATLTRLKRELRDTRVKL